MGQSVFDRQTAHVPSGAHSLPVCDAQSALVRHWTQVESVVWQNGAVAEHCAFEVHPARHEKSCGSQIGWAVPQSALLKQLTHCPWPTRQRGCAAGQSELVSQCTHCDVVGSQMVPIVDVAQSIEDLHPTHAPLLLVVSQIGVGAWQSVLVAHAAWHV